MENKQQEKKQEDLREDFKENSIKDSNKIPNETPGETPNENLKEKLEEDLKKKLNENLKGKKKNEPIVKHILPQTKTIRSGNSFVVIPDPATMREMERERRILQEFKENPHKKPPFQYR